MIPALLFRNSICFLNIKGVAVALYLSWETLWFCSQPSLLGPPAGILSISGWWHPTAYPKGTCWNACKTERTSATYLSLARFTAAFCLIYSHSRIVLTISGSYWPAYEKVPHLNTHAHRYTHTHRHTQRTELNSSYDKHILPSTEQTS